MAVVEEAARIIGGPACLLLPLDEALAATLPGQFTRDAVLQAEPVLRAASPADATPDDGAMAAARWALANGRPAGRGTATLPTSAWRFLPLTAVREGEAVALGLLGMRPEAEAPDPEADRAIEALLDQAAVALERARLADIAANARARGQTEALRTALLTSLGHDLRTPLTTIRGAAETLRTAGAALSEATRADLLASIEEEATRLARWMSAILDIVRLESWAGCAAARAGGCRAGARGGGRPCGAGACRPAHPARLANRAAAPAFSTPRCSTGCWRMCWTMR